MSVEHDAVVDCRSALLHCHQTFRNRNTRDKRTSAVGVMLRSYKDTCIFLSSCNSYESYNSPTGSPVSAGERSDRSYGISFVRTYTPEACTRDRAPHAPCKVRFDLRVILELIAAKTYTRLFSSVSYFSRILPPYDCRIVK